MEAFLSGLKPYADVLGVPAALVALAYSILQIRKIWFDSKKSELDVKKVTLEIQRLEAEVEKSEPSTQPTIQSPTQTYDKIAERNDILIFVPLLIFTLTMFFWNGSTAQTQKDFFNMMLYGVLFISSLQMLLLVVGSRLISRMLLATHSSIAQMLLLSNRIQLSSILSFIETYKSPEWDNANQPSDEIEKVS